MGQRLIVIREHTHIHTRIHTYTQTCGLSKNMKISVSKTRAYSRKTEEERKGTKSDNKNTHSSDILKIITVCRLSIEQIAIKVLINFVSEQFLTVCLLAYFIREVFCDERKSHSVVSWAAQCSQKRGKTHQQSLKFVLHIFCTCAIYTSSDKTESNWRHSMDTSHVSWLTATRVHTVG